MQRTELFWLLSLCGFAAMSLACGLLAWPQLSAAWPSIEERIDRFRRQPPLAKVVLLLFVGAFVVFGGGKTNQVDQTSGTNEVEIVEGGTNEIVRLFGLFDCSIEEVRPSVTPEDMARGWQLWEVKTNCNISYAMPESAAFATNWWVRGAFEDVSQFDFGDWRFPFGSNGYSSVWTLTWGKLRFALADTNTEIVAVGAPMSAVPYRSRLWSAADTNGSRLVTWENFALNRDTNTPVNAQVELRTTGDFITRSNEVETVYRRLDPEDWDDDGWRNEDDSDPYVWEEFWDSFWQELPGGANESAYCWIEIRPRWHSYIEFVGDSPSNLDDPYLWAKAGETYRVRLLIGKTYFIECTQPVDVVGRSSSSIVIDGDGTGELTVVWPLMISTFEGNGRSFRMSVSPFWLGGIFEWTDSCCTIFGDDLVFRYGCNGNCGCSGCYAAGYYVYEGYRVAVSGCWCGCSSNDEHEDTSLVGVAVSFSDRTILLENEYEDSHGSVIPWRSTATDLTCTIRGGDYGGYVRIDISGDENLIQYTGQSLTYTRTVLPHERIEFTNRYKATAESDKGEGIVVTATFVENETGWADFSSARATAVRIWTFTLSDWIPYRQRKELGVGEEVRIVQFPYDVDDALTVDYCARDQYGWNYQAPSAAGTQTVTVRSGGAQLPLEFSIVEPAELKAEIFGSLPNTVAGVAGGFETTFFVYVLPTNVSFSAAQVMEEGCVATNAVGCFTWPEMAGLLNHSGHGADGWHGLNKLNRFYDTVRMTHMSSWGTGGSFTWPIPNLWKVGGGGDSHYFPHSPSYDQRVEVDADGTSRIMKFSYTIEQMTNLQFRVTGGR